ncbi:MAG TPA: bifunctional demethylmenaquinone methyltransferase/2-methoxy-6-polyprenyl-1,4-benzoquinol methylase UbiE [Bryobacteraceae bacterium]|jgi:demethylmenaquinone methyltransferase/2-methoxy-6-polyprenyl-1,4-benzoquinol methylase|nr:bifunctional demethylmenaquinone methyltransferase/2-methoxy-6-polyprenyl-1,4-benzoquinol methylase UbiE [Bryobacteraceae bacterium]
MAAGTTPPGATDEAQAAKWVQRAFAEVAPKYDLLNHLLSFNIDRSWRKRIVKRLRPVLERPNARVLDLCCGTGDVLLDLQSAAKSAIIGADFCHPMLVAASRKIAKKNCNSILFEGDALQLALRNDSLDAIAIAFGFRNLTNYEGGLRELYRVLKPGGNLAIVEFSHVQGGLMRFFYGSYSRWILPLIGRAVSGSKEAYSYLPASIAKFPRAERLREMMLVAGFREADYELLTGGISALHFGTK